jgi:hypothetical protein
MGHKERERRKRQTTSERQGESQRDEGQKGGDRRNSGWEGEGYAQTGKQIGRE